MHSSGLDLREEHRDALSVADDVASADFRKAATRLQQACKVGKVLINLDDTPRLVNLDSESYVSPQLASDGGPSLSSWLVALRGDIQNILRKELSVMREQWSSDAPKRDVRVGLGELRAAHTRCDDALARGSGRTSPRKNVEIPNVYGPERSLSLRVGDRVVVFKEARTKGRTGTVIDPSWQPGLVQVAMHEADEKGNLKSYKHEDLRLIKEKVESLCVGSRVVILKAGRTQGRTGTVADPKYGPGVVQLTMDEADELGSLNIYKLEDLRLIQERNQSLRAGDRVAVSKQARTKGRTGTVIEPDWQMGLVQVEMDEADEKGKTKSYKLEDLMLIQDLKLMQERPLSWRVGGQFVVSKEGPDKGKTGTVLDPDWQLGLIQVSMDEADTRGRIRCYKPDDLRLIDDAFFLTLSKFSTGRIADIGSASCNTDPSSFNRSFATTPYSLASARRAYGFEVLESTLGAHRYSGNDRFGSIKTYFPPPRRESYAARLVGSKLFFGVIMFLVCGNVVWVGFSANEQMKNHRFRQQTAVRWIDLGFNSLFIVEMLLKIAGLRANYFVGKDWAWNCFDFTLAIISIIELILANHNAKSLANSLSVVRLFRICKLFHVMRLITELRLLVFVLYHSMATLVWVFVVYFFVTYCFSVIIMQSAVSYVEGTDDRGFAPVRAKYGHVWDSMLIVLNMLTGGDWAEAVQPLAKLSFAYKVMFAAYMFFMTFGMLNVVIGVVCEKALFAIDSDKVLRIVRHRDNDATFLKAMYLMFKEMDVNGSGYVSMNEFLAYIDNNDTGDYLRSYGINTHSPHELFSFLDMQDGQSTGEIDCPSFIIAMQRLAGGVQSSDIVLLRRDVRELKKIMTKRFPMHSDVKRDDSFFTMHTDVKRDDSFSSFRLDDVPLSLIEEEGVLMPSESDELTAVDLSPASLRSRRG